jgi:hypothetical protein
MTKPIKPAPRTSRNTALPACSGDPLIDHAVTVMDLSGFKNRISRKILATALFEVRKIGKLTTKLEHWSKEIGINSHYLQTAFTVLQEFGLLVREMDGGLKYFVDEHRLRDPSTLPVKSVRRTIKSKADMPGDSGSTLSQCEKLQKITPRTRCVECGVKVEFFADKVKHVCVACDLRRQKKGYRG